MGQLKRRYQPPQAAIPREFPMVRWIAFDDETAEAVVSRLRRGAAEIQHDTPVDAALRAQGPAVIVLPSSTPGKLLIARFTKHKAKDPIPTIKPSTNTSAQVTPKKQTASVKKPWWRKFVA
jgi:hypothetical protein